MSNYTLAKVASVLGFVTASTGYAFHYRIQHDIRESEAYKDAVNAFRAHKKAVPYLGEPVTLGRITYGIGEHEGLIAYKWYRVVVKGSNTKGTLYYEIRPSAGSVSELVVSKLEITFDNIPGKTFTIRESEAR